MPPPLTDEQRAFVHATLAPDSVTHINAVAGSGKTTTLLQFILANAERRILYIVFNRDAQQSAERRMRDCANATPRTLHSLAYEAVRSHRTAQGISADAGVQSYVADTQLAALLDSSYDAPIRSTFSARPARRALTALFERYCGDTQRTLDKAYLAEQVSELKCKKGGSFFKKMRAAELPVYVDALRFMWDAMIAGRLALTFGACAKHMFLQPPRIDTRYDIVLVDEAQDFTAQYAGVVMAWRPLPIVFVGDTAQHIYGWQGTRSAFALTRATASYPLTHSFRFGDAIADVARAVVAHDAIVGASRHAGHVYVEDVETMPPRRHLFGERDIAYVHRSNAALLHCAKELARRDATLRISVIGRGRSIISDTMKYVEMCTTRRWQFDARRVEAEDAGDRAQLELLDWIWSNPQRARDDLEALSARIVNQGTQADVYLGTVHACKGLEWDVVALQDDLVPRGVDTDAVAPHDDVADAAPCDDGSGTGSGSGSGPGSGYGSTTSSVTAAAAVPWSPIDTLPRTRQRTTERDEGWRLLYVAVTRARHKLIVSPRLWRAIELRRVAELVDK